MSTLITLPDVAGVLAKTEDEVMFLVQSQRLKNTIDEETMTWRFNLTDVLSIKTELEEEALAEQADPQLLNE